MKKLIVFLFLLTLGFLGYFVGTEENKNEVPTLTVINIEDELKELD